MILTGMFLYVIRRCISAYVVTFRSKQSSEWLMQNVNNWGVGNLLWVMCIKLEWIFYFLNKTGILQIYPPFGYYVP